MRELTQQYLKSIMYYDAETGVFTWAAPRRRIRVGDTAGCRHSSGYIRAMIDGKAYMLHRLAWLYTYGQWPEHEIDHVNGVCDDNRIANLRDVTRDENMRNTKRYRSNASGCTGVQWSKQNQRWQADIYTEKRVRKHLGCFNDWFDAVCARKSAENRYNYHPNHDRAAAKEKIIASRSDDC